MAGVGVGGRKGGGWASFHSAILFELRSTDFVHSSPRGDGNKITCLENFRVKNQPSA